MYMDEMNRVLDYIEAHLTDDISYCDMAGMLAMSIYEFRRIFAFVIGTPISDYIRLRRLSSAMFDLQTGEASITDIAAKYRYDSPAAFSRAFREMQGVSPTAARRDGVLLHAFPRAALTLSVSGATGICFRLMRRGKMKLCGHSGITDSNAADCGETVWNEYFDGGIHDRLLQCGAFTAEHAEFAAYENVGRTQVRCTIGALLPTDAETPPGMDVLEIAPALWGVFEVTGTMDDQINTAYYKTIAEWLGASAYRRDPDACNLEAFPVEDRFESRSMRWQIYYPLIPKPHGSAPTAADDQKG